jgi:hypothetical protein
MCRRKIGLLIAVAALAVAAPARADESDLAVLISRNIFLRDRHRPEPPGPVEVKTIEQMLVITGIVIQGGNARVSIENIGTHRVFWRAAGDSLAWGNIRQAQSNQILYVNNAGIERWITPGCDLTGAAYK